MNWRRVKHLVVHRERRRTPPPAEPFGLIATLPKSGTWLSHTFLWCYDQLLRHADRHAAEGWVPDLFNALAQKQIASEGEYNDTLGIRRLYIAHTICPGYYKIHDPYRAAWDRLSFPLPYNWGEKHIRGYGEWDRLEPADNPKARIIYLFRNPLDHFVSYWQHAQVHQDDIHRFIPQADGSRVPITSLHQFVFDFTVLDAYIKHYHSFRAVRQTAPNQVMMLPYETLVADRGSALAAMLAFLGAPVDSEEKRVLFNAALAMTSKEALAALETQMGRSLAGDLKGNARHIKSGESGRWQGQFSAEELARIENRFQEFGLSLSEFTLKSPAVESRKRARAF